MTKGINRFEGNKRKEKAHKRAELADTLNCAYGDVDCVEGDTYINKVTNKQYTVITKRVGFEIKEV